MRSIKFLTTDGLKTATIAERYDELTLSQLIAIERNESTDPLQVFAILTGMDVAFIDNQSEQLENTLFDIVAPLFTTRMDMDALKPPTHLLIDGTLVKVPKPAKLTLGQNIMFMTLLERAKDLYEAIPEALAIFFQPELDGDKFDRHRVEATKKKLLRSQGLEALAVFGFFLTNVKRWKTTTASVLHLVNKTPPNYFLQMKKKHGAASNG